jgi:hypothetical protein
MGEHDIPDCSHTETTKGNVIVVECFFNCICNPVYDIWFTCSQRRLNNLMIPDEGYSRNLLTSAYLIGYVRLTL